MKPTEIPRAELEAALKNLESWKDHADPFYLRCIRALLERAEDTERLNSGRIWLPIVQDGMYHTWAEQNLREAIDAARKETDNAK